MLAQVRAFGYAGVGAEGCSCGLVQVLPRVVWREWFGASGLARVAWREWSGASGLARVVRGGLKPVGPN